MVLAVVATAAAAVAAAAAAVVAASAIFVAAAAAVVVTEEAFAEQHCSSRGEVVVRCVLLMEPVLSVSVEVDTASPT